jgi:hypothetical protein
MDERCSEMRHFSLKGIRGEVLEGGSFAGDPDESNHRVPETGHLSPWGALLREPGGGASFLGALEFTKRRFWGWTGAQLGNLSSPHLLGTSRYGSEGLWWWGVSLCGSSGKGTKGWVPLMGTLEDIWKRLWRWVSLSLIEAPFWRTWRRVRLPGALRDG